MRPAERTGYPRNRAVARKCNGRTGVPSRHEHEAGAECHFGEAEAQRARHRRCRVCLIAFHWQPDGPVPLVLVANRDEFYERLTAPLAWWEGGRLLAGRDLRAGGTW